MASVLQHSSALQQTLAPERTPSFGENLPTPLRAAFGFTGSNGTPGGGGGGGGNNNFGWSSASSGTGRSHLSQVNGKVASSEARPGNKRLASQVLVPDTAKVGKLGGGMGATFSFWDSEGDDGLGGGAGVVKVG